MNSGSEILVFGATGQVGSALRAFPGVTALTRQDADLLRPEACYEAICARRPAAVINASAYTAVDSAEQEEDQARIVNADSPAVMARACRELGIPLLHISTDYVFDGTGTAPWTEAATPAPLNAYGRTKLLGEQAIQSSGCRYAILRTSWVFAPQGTNFVRTMLRLSEGRKELKVVNDQIGGPTPAASLAQTLFTMTQEMQNGATGGLYHYAGEPWVSWYDFAQEIFLQAQREVSLIAVGSDSFPSPAKRPLNTCLGCSRIEADFSIRPPDWKAALKDVINAHRTES